MKSLLFLFPLIYFFAFKSQAQNFSTTENLLAELNTVSINKVVYEGQKKVRIHALQQEVLKTRDLEERYKEYEVLYEEYKSYSYDSSSLYAKELLFLAEQINDPGKINRAKMKLAFTLLSSGLFKETLEELNNIVTNQLSKADRQDYYYLKARSYFDLSDYDRSRDYNALYDPKGIQCIDSALSIADSRSAVFLELKGLKQLRTGNFSEGRNTYTSLLNFRDLSPHQFAVNACCLSYINERLGFTAESEDLLIKAAISDVQSATKETVASYKLADLLYKKGDIQNSYLYIKQAMDDATFFGALHRQVKISSILPIIEAQRIKQIEHQKKVLTYYVLLISLLGLFVVAFAIIIFRQLKKLRIADNLIKAANFSLQLNNTTLEELNKHLSTANKIKNEYIGYYFNINTVYLDKLASIKKSLDKKLSSKRYEDAHTAVNNIDLDQERKVIFDTFDEVFLRLFPCFISRFNLLFHADHKLLIPAGQLLTTEHRIFALIRMGIHDSDRIAKLLGYSVNTIYAYKNRIKTKSLIANETFEEQIMLIEAV